MYRRTTSRFAELSAWGHVIDSWRYLSAASSALLNAYRHRALHLSYYAELRAALGILSSSGVVILNGKNYAIDKGGLLQWFKGRTHQVTWEAFSEWTKLSGSPLAVTEALSINTVAGIPWLEVCRASLTADDIAKRWLSDWSFDLTQIADDQLARNEASYNADLSSNNFTRLNFKDLILVHQANRAGMRNFLGTDSQVQMALVLDLCRKSAEIRYTGEACEARFWRDTIMWMETHSKLTRPHALDIVAAIRNSDDSAAGHILRLTDTAKRNTAAVFARAYYLSHVASALLFTHRKQIALRAPGGVISWPDILIRQLGLQAHLWNDNSAPSDLTVIDSDIEAALDELADIHPHRFEGGFQLWQTKGSALAELCRLERQFVTMGAA